MDDRTKACTKCGVTKPLSEFYGDKRKRDGKVSRCKPCANADRVASVNKNRDHYRAYLAGWHQDNAARRKAQDASRYRLNRETRRAQIKAWSESNPDLRREHAAASYQKNRDAVLLRSKARAEANPGYRAEVSRRRRAHEANATLGPVDLAALWDACGGACYLCGGPIDPGVRHPDPSSKSIDHVIPLSKGGAHAQDNLAWTHLVCNVRKGVNDGRVYHAGGLGPVR